eukprot:UN04663
MEKHNPKTPKMEKEAIVFATAVMEYLCAEILELAGNAAKDDSREFITRPDVQLAISKDTELNQLLVNLAKVEKIEVTVT